VEGLGNSASHSRAISLQIASFYNLFLPPQIWLDMCSPTKDKTPEHAEGGGHKAADIGTAAQPEEDEDAIEAGDIDDDEDAGYYTDTASSVSTSLSSSVRDYAFENGRRYHKFREGAYQFPNDEPEQAREDMKHAMLVNVCDGRLHYAPLGNSQQILDIGTGTGIWCIDSKSSCSVDAS
jgi:hypothetical protein